MDVPGNRRRGEAPVAAIVGSRDEYLDGRPQELIDAFRRNASRARSFTGSVVPGARHGFQNRERELADLIVRWIRTHHGAPRP